MILLPAHVAACGGRIIHASDRKPIGECLQISVARLRHRVLKSRGVESKEEHKAHGNAASDGVEDHDESKCFDSGQTLMSFGVIRFLKRNKNLDAVAGDDRGYAL